MHFVLRIGSRNIPQPAIFQFTIKVIDMAGQFAAVKGYAACLCRCLVNETSATVELLVFEAELSVLLHRLIALWNHKS